MRLSVVLEARVRRSVMGLTRLACVIALLGLCTFAVSMLYPRPLVVIFSMSIGHVIGGLAFLVYVLAIVLDTVRGREPALKPSPEPSPEPPEIEEGKPAVRQKVVGRRRNRRNP